MSDTLYKGVSLASDVKKYIKNPIVDIDIQKRKLIESTNDDEFIMLIKKNSFDKIKIIDVYIIDEEKLKNY